ncbi:unnamed protein product, partial [Nesidiocoris tenuis]
MKVALGPSVTGCFTNSTARFKQIQKAGTRTGDRVWRMPLYDAFTNRVTSNFLTNFGIRYEAWPVPWVTTDLAVHHLDFTICKRFLTSGFQISLQSTFTMWDKARTAAVVRARQLHSL